MNQALLEFIKRQKAHLIAPTTTPVQQSFNSVIDEEEAETLNTTVRQKPRCENTPIKRCVAIDMLSEKLIVRALENYDGDPPYKYLLEMSDSTWKVLNRDDNEGFTASGKYCYVKKCGEHFIRIIEAGKGAHILLAECHDALDYAGEVFFSDNGELLWWDNFSGSFQPSPKLSHQVEFFAEDKFIARSGTAEEKSSDGLQSGTNELTKPAVF